MSVQRHRGRRRPLRAALAAFAGLAMALTVTPAMSSASASVEEPAAGQPSAADLPSSFQWTSPGPVVSVKPDSSHDVVSVKDPTVVQYDGEWQVYFTVANTDGAWSLAHTSFTDWSQANEAPHTFLDTNPDIGNRYAAAPHLFYFEPRDEWHLVYQTGLPSYSVSDDPGDPHSWSAPRNYQDEMPDIVRENIGNGHWLDYWVICDDTMCYLFSADDNGHLYRAETTVAEFPEGFDNTRIVLEDTPNNLFEGEAVYYVEDTGTYLLIMEAIGSDGRRWYRSFTADTLDSPWQPLADTQDNPFARANNVSFPQGAWTQDISHGELLRNGYDQRMTIDSCELQLLYQGLDPAAGGDYSQLPWHLGLATQTNSAC
ncbi:non-reducing end alpha-L-arabinofuranosidase family hydrolase [Streptomyces sp. MP131-18]|uniref:non-reducing end alpha-L-arabinofuranosidase family hydrolase n=1 Tax=Streptomyces sp. MP131-18 TaxID=1857892 RepID=UPI00097C3888|nr:non-reducing end alpha-L-arabinofuranosidase family hydrolase [Streptomyces sp. MP131-18]ONK10554.1 Alpha-L-arabinofuranosidase C precursor [Streptomyces sp. MP131-18]